ncbi:MAG TPA: hypothetical protein VF940_06370 [Streptosporangiaceae bacterium]
MTGEAALERRYRRLLAWYPAKHRRAYGEEMIGVLMAAAPDGASRPGLAGACDLIGGGLRARFRSRLRWLAGADWTDALAVCSVAVPVILASYFTAGWLWNLRAITPVTEQVGRGVVVLAIAAPPLLALRYRRTAALIALALAGGYIFATLNGISPNWRGYWIIYGGSISGSVAWLLGAIALALSPGPRRALEILTPKSWVVLAGSGIAIGLIGPYLWLWPAWLAAVIVLAVLATITAALLLTIPGTAAPGLLILLAVPAYPGAVWATFGHNDSVVNHPFRFPNLVFLPTVLFACLAVAAVWRCRRRSAA